MRKNSPYSIYYVLSLLNHKVLEWISTKTASVFERDYIAHGQTLLRDLPIRKINFKDSKERSAHDRIVKIVEEIIKLHKELKLAKTDREKKKTVKSIKQKRNNLDGKINSLYGIENLIKYAEIS